MWDAEKDDEAAFESRVDAIMREVAERGKPVVPEAVPPFREPTLSPAPAAVHDRPRTSTSVTPGTAPAVTSAPAPAAAQNPPATMVPAAAQNTPSTQQQPLYLAPSPQGALAGLMEVSKFVTEQLKSQRDHDERVRVEMESQLRHMREQMQEQMQERLHEQQIAALQSRLLVLHATQLLTDDELFSLEDCVADSLEAAAGEDDRVARMVALSGNMAVNATFARQLRRKFIV